MTEELTCTICGISKSLSKFPKEGHRYRHQCKICRNAQKRERIKRNPQKNKEYLEKNKDKLKQYRKKYMPVWHEKNKEREKQYRIDNKDRIISYQREYAKTDKRKITSLNCTHKRLRKFKDSDITTDYLLLLKSITQFCSCCGNKLKYERTDKHSYHLDHIIPVKIGGKHMRNNIRYICKSCNLSRPKDGSDIPLEKLKNILND